MKFKEKPHENSSKTNCKTSVFRACPYIDNNLIINKIHRFIDWYKIKEVALLS